MSNFAFVADKILRKNMDIALDHIVDLLAISESRSYKGKRLLVSSLRKTIMIHVASIVEALLLCALKEKIKKEEIELYDDWKYFDLKILHKKSSHEEVIAGIRKKEIKKIGKLDFFRIIDLCKKHNIIKASLNDDIHKLRKLRNKLHIGGLNTMEKEYKKNDLEFVFGIMNKVKKILNSKK